MSGLRCRTTIARHAGRAKAKLQPRDAWSVAEARRGVLEIKALFLCGLDVVSHRPRFVLHFVHAVLHDVADRDNADEPALIDHRHVAKLSGCHPLHDAGDRFTFVAGLNLPRHRSTHRKIERGYAALRQPSQCVGRHRG
jgi:hypothetical protein